MAAAAQVSIATVSRVVNNPKLVSAKTAARVQEAIARLGYVPNPFAQGLITRASGLLGLALPDIYGEFYSELLRGADAEAKTLGYHLLVSSGHGSGPEAGEALSPVLGLLEGLALMVTEPNDRLMQQLSKLSMPIVMLDAESPDPRADTILVDNEAGAKAATNHLLASVRPEQCCFVGGPRENFDTATRARAFVSALQARGHTLLPEQVTFGTYAFDWGLRWGQEFFDRDPRAEVGVLAGNDEIAYGIMQAARDRGVRVPEQIKVVGFDDTRLASLVRPTLSSVRVPLFEVGASAVRTLVQRLQEPNSPPARVRLTPTLMVRDSSSSLPRAK